VEGGRFEPIGPAEGARRSPFAVGFPFTPTYPLSGINRADMS